MASRPDLCEDMLTFPPKSKEGYLCDGLPDPFSFNISALEPTCGYLCEGVKLVMVGLNEVCCIDSSCLSVQLLSTPSIPLSLYREHICN